MFIYIYKKEEKNTLCGVRSMKFQYYILHIQIPPDQLRRSHISQYAVATVSRCTIEGTMRVLCSYWMHGRICHSSIRALA